MANTNNTFFENLKLQSGKGQMLFWVITIHIWGHYTFQSALLNQVVETGPEVMEHTSDNM